MKILRANAKINLGLKIVGKLDNGYHLLDSVFAPIDLSDILELSFLKTRTKNSTLHITTNKKEIPTDEKNILFKIYDAFYKKSNLEREDIKIHLIKKIPAEAGLGGGSSDGGIFLLELNKYHNNYYNNVELKSIAKSVGADVPFFLLNKSARAKGIGEELEEIENNINGKLLLIKPNFGVSAGQAYSLLKDVEKKSEINIKKILEALKENDISNVLLNIGNHLEDALSEKDENLLKFKSKLQEVSLEKYCMSGSGSTFYTILDEAKVDGEYELLKKEFPNYELYICNFI